MSGEALVSNARSLLRLLRGVVGDRREEALRGELPILRKRANATRPPRRRAADAISLGTLMELVRRAEGAKMSRGERQAVDIFLVAFATMSRVGEVAALKVSDVSPEGDTISIRPKTSAGTGLRLTKLVSNTHGLEAADRLREYREAATKQGKTHLFRGRGGKPPETAAVTRLLRAASTRLGMRERITSHSARKGAAVEALLAGVPLPVIQALGAWKDINSLQAYVGDSVRRSTGLLRILKEQARACRSKTREKREAKGCWVRWRKARQRGR